MLFIALFGEVYKLITGSAETGYIIATTFVLIGLPIAITLSGESKIVEYSDIVTLSNNQIIIPFKYKNENKYIPINLNNAGIFRNSENITFTVRKL